ncbi:DUF3298 and DUF4163 domain-containing protein [Paenibacillus flagellatus]|uniref:DUF3298 domain-containing protein n=1 Tax=Paenibacillus flagellatus TaxID=2211139 RepID=A0A2V5K7B8_9BACL|nr:DUF3298 and DUF4163 domain-containing protein [Paenibacillus flagellatus]PYI53854.1 hypothetical protein DLM86_14965 [Paenibacillus flagellatus]
MNPPYTLPLQIQTVRRTGPKFELYVPRVVQAPNAAAQVRMNNAIAGQIQSMLRQLGYTQHPHTTEINGFYEIKTNERGLLSVALNVYGYTEHAAHGLTLIRSLTFDTSTGKAYTLGELFASGSGYVKRISDIVKAQIAERGIQTLAPFASIRPDQDYYVADKALVVYFQLYEITPYVFGFPMFPISVYSLQDLIPDASPIQPMTVNG